MIYDFDPINVEPGNIGSINDHPIIEEQTKTVATSCNHDDVRYTPVNFGQGDNFQEDDHGINLKDEPETHQTASAKEGFSSLFFHRNEFH